MSADSPMHRVISFLRDLWTRPILARDIRAEAFALGGRHMGDVVQGARAELGEPNISWRRTLLLRAVIAAHAG
jgi:hypothetical protein